MQTSAIRHRVTDFLARYPPFQEIDEDDLLALVERGRVKFHECEEFVYWQKSAPGPFVFVIQQGTVSLIEEAAGQEKLCDVRGAGDLLGIERFLGAPHHLYSARTNSDVILYALPAQDFEALLGKYPAAAKYVESHASVSAGFHAAGHRALPSEIRVYDVAWTHNTVTCSASGTLQQVARRMVQSGVHSAAVLDAAHGVLGLITPGSILEGIAAGRLTPASPVSQAIQPPCCVAPQHTVSDTVLAMARSRSTFAAMTSDGTPSGKFDGIVDADCLAAVFGSTPFDSLPRVATAAGTAELHQHHRRARSFLLEQATSPASIGWMASWATEFDRHILHRILDLSGHASGDLCWCFSGASGRGEKLTVELPALALIVSDPARLEEASDIYRDVVRQFVECGYRRFDPPPDDPGFACATLAEWAQRYADWVRDPILNMVYDARPFFDMSPAAGNASLCDRLRLAVEREIEADRSFVRILAHDCLNSMPPIAFLEDYVVDEHGAQLETFQLQRSALWPLVDVARVLSMSAGQAFGASTAGRLAAATRRLPQHERVFREASETLQVVLYQQARSGLRAESNGAELPPSILSRHDRQALKSGFRSIVRLLQFMESGLWKEAV
ncbi:MAG: cyclic nucleotide-binding domain-containing protein [Bryobacterales bacterium]|nr:cyclic nucleotide-binding domain-containing protein [Bryobacterales bacterium]